MRPGFSAWRRWIDRRMLPGLACPGVYVLCVSDVPIADKPFGWRREIIYVGMTNSVGGLASRLRQFDDTIARRRTSHGGAERVRFKYRNYAHMIKKLFVSVCPIACDVTSKFPRDLRLMGKVAELEYVCLARYMRKFGRLPEFNDKSRSPKWSP